MTDIQKQIAALEQQIATVSALRDALRPEYNRIGAELHKYYNIINSLNSKIQELKLSTISASDISWLLTEEWSTNIRDAFAKLVGFDSYELGISGRWVGTNQSVIQIVLNRATPVKARAIWDKMVELLPHVITHDDGYRRIKIMDHDLSESGIVNILIDSENVFYKSLTCYGHNTVTKIGDSQQAFEYFFKNHYYQ